MRACVWWASVVSFAFIFTATGPAAYTSNEPVPNQPAASLAEPWTKSLVTNESYRRDGVIEEMSTCLLVAADDDAYDLWRNNIHWQNMDLPTLADTLTQSPPDKKKKPGFGTVLACSQILMAWHTSLPSQSRSRPTFSVDGRVEHGAVVIDLALGRHSERARIKPLPLVRLLTSPHLLPSWTYGGIIIRNAVIEGTLLLHNLHLSVPLAFANVKFIGGGYRKDVYKVVRDEVEAAISILHSRFQDHILIASSEICGDVLINDSQFDEKFDWHNVTQITSQKVKATAKVDRYECVDNDDASTPSGLYIHASTFRQSLRFNRTHLGALSSYSNRIGRFLSWQTRFGDQLTFSDNDVGSFDVSSHLATKTAINFNRIENDFFLFGHSVMEGRIDSVDINSNRIGGGIGFSNFPSGVLPETISLESNHVGNGSLLCVPRHWTGTLSLDGSSYDGKLAIGVTRSLDPKAEADELDDDSESLKCSWQSWTPERFHEDENVYCKDLRSRAFLQKERKTPRKLGVVKVDLEAVEVRTLVWQLPLQCKYRWSGFGLDYRLWHPAENAAEILSEQTGHWDLSPLRVFKAWRTTLWGHEPAPLDMMSRYLTENGAYNESREILLEAKRLNYAPACKPTENTLTCADSMLFGGMVASFFSDPEGGASSSAIAADAKTVPQEEQGEPSVEPSAFSANGKESFLERFRGTSMLLLLWPGGYGAKPERAVGLIGLSAIVFFVIYVGYAWIMRRSLRRVPEQIGVLMPKPDENSSQQSDGSRPSPRPDEAAVNALRKLWDDRTRGWSDLDLDRRLEIVRNDLMPALARHREQLSKADQQRVKTLRRRLERFGNTEILGFSRFDSNKMPTRFTHWRYSVDTMLPFIDLHAYSNYYPEAGWMRAFSICQHVIGWWFMTVFVASAAIL